MSDTPPPPLPPEAPPPQFVAYPRGTGPQGDPDRLQALADGYFGLNTVFYVNVVLLLSVVYGIPLLFVSLFESSPGVGLVIYPVAILILFIVIGFLVYPKAKRIGEGLGWAPAGAVVAAILIAMNSVVCCGAVGYVIVQQMAYTEMKKYGLRSKFLGVPKKKVVARIAELRDGSA